jgi:hypothetical protein
MGDFPGFPFRRLCIHIGMALPLRLPPSILNLPENTLGTDLGAIFCRAGGYPLGASIALSATLCDLAPFPSRSRHITCPHQDGPRSPLSFDRRLPSRHILPHPAIPPLRIALLNI